MVASKKGLDSLILILFYFLWIGNLSSAYAQSEIQDYFSKGNYSVGFYSKVVLDFGQNYIGISSKTIEKKKHPKPLIINIWYPAEKTRNPKFMLQKEYLKFSSDDLSIKEWLDEYGDYTEKAIVQGLFSKDKNELDSIERIQLESFLTSTTGSIKNAQVQDGKFPLVIYHQGAEASLVDNSLFCEWLASYGYVVVGSSFQSAMGEKLSSHGLEDSLIDLRFLLTYLHELAFVDWQNVAMIGHSLGAQTVNYIASRDNIPIDAMVSLETTQEYYFGDHGLWPFANDVKENANKVVAKCLFVSNPYAIHDLADQMINAERYYLSIPDIGHNEFISQGIQKIYFYKKRSQDDEGENYFDRDLKKYSQLCDYILKFFDAQLKYNKKGWLDLVRNDSSTLGLTPFIETMEKGKSKDVRIESNNSIPTPRQLKFLIISGKIDSAIQLINKFSQEAAYSPVYNPVYIYSITNYLLDSDPYSAEIFYKVYVNILGRSIVNKHFIYFGVIFSFLGEKESAKKAFEKLSILDQENGQQVKILIQKYLR